MSDTSGAAEKNDGDALGKDVDVEVATHKVDFQDAENEGHIRARFDRYGLGFLFSAGGKTMGCSINCSSALMPTQLKPVGLNVFQRPRERANTALGCCCCGFRTSSMTICRNRCPHLNTRVNIVLTTIPLGMLGQQIFTLTFAHTVSTMLGFVIM